MKTVNEFHLHNGLKH